MPHKSLHRGELYVQQRRNTPIELSQAIPRYIDNELPDEHAHFFSKLPYLPLATVDSEGRPWVSLVVTQSKTDPKIGISITGKNKLSIVTKVNSADPFFNSVLNESENTVSEPLVAGVGIDFSTRRRNKLAGKISAVSTDQYGRLSLNIESNEHLGNCPKYITKRSLEPTKRSSEMGYDFRASMNGAMPDECKSLIQKANTAFLATIFRPPSDDQESQPKMGLNHRGGSPGFVRVYEEKSDVDQNITTYLVLPDHSGNRFYQSLGNIQAQSNVGMTFPDFSNGNMLYITGVAENLFDDDANEIMPRVNLLTRIRITGMILIRRGLFLRMTSEEQLSPYNPPVRLLKTELKELGLGFDGGESHSNPPKAKLLKVEKVSSIISTFTFELSEAIDMPLPGGFGIFDFSEALDSGYSHMNELNPQSINEDYIRTWTLSNAPEYELETCSFQKSKTVDITVKRKSGGLVSNVLHEQTGLQEPLLYSTFKGTGLGFSCFKQDASSNNMTVPEKMLWIAGGVGLTPFMSMWQGLINLSKALDTKQESIKTDIVLLFSGRDDDVELLRHFVKNDRQVPQTISLTIFAYQSSGAKQKHTNHSFQYLQQEFSSKNHRIEQRRIESRDLSEVKHLKEREVFLCGPDVFMREIEIWLKYEVGEQLTLHRESYFF